MNLDRILDLVAYSILTLFALGVVAAFVVIAPEVVALVVVTLLLCWAMSRTGR